MRNFSCAKSEFYIIVQKSFSLGFWLTVASSLSLSLDLTLSKKTNRNRNEEKSRYRGWKWALKWTHLRSVPIEKVESGSVRVLHKKIVHCRSRRLLSASLRIPCNAIQCHWLFVDNMDDHVRRMSHWCVWSYVLCVALMHFWEVSVHSHLYL